ncbi:outer membrane protein assembly factor BamD [Azospirillum sp. sgz301742]
MPSPRLLRTPVAALLLVSALAACSSDKDDLAYVERPPEQIFDEAEANMKKENYKTAAKLFDEVERQHPYSAWATRAQLRAAYAHYENLKYDDAILALDRFIQLHPGSPEVAYAYYMRALSYYEQITDVARDQRMTRRALDALSDVVRRFPDTPYARDARIKIDLTNDHLAGKEMEIGRFYMRQAQYTAAINRFRTVVEQYQTTSHTAEALHRLVECYLALGVNDEASTAAAVLGHNFPGSEWYQDSYAMLVEHKLQPERNTKSWLSKAWNSLF